GLQLDAQQKSFATASSGRGGCQKDIALAVPRSQCTRSKTSNLFFCHQNTDFVMGGITNNNFSAEIDLRI
ncbi:hypothetical protein PQQ96_23275, partial [Paraburkholderia sediminicola]|uniref:hypothetical protein n=1 Tax=Paraburkholderia sediminicola TaxID=458836 RepID=UPI0038BBD89D